MQCVFQLTQNQPPTKEQLRRMAAQIGPGYRGVRRSSTQAERAMVARQYEEFGEMPPGYVLIETQWVDRPAKLFEAAEYPDKGVTVTTEDLGELCRNFDMPVPVLIEHAESPLELGFLTGVQQVGSELFGTIALTQEADAVVRRSGAKSLSLGLAPDLREIREVSLVRNPRVETAQLFSGTVEFSGELEPPSPPAPSPTTNHAGEGNTEFVNFRAKYEALLSKQRSEEAERQVLDFIRQGKLCPAQAEEVRALLMLDRTVKFGHEEVPIRQLVLAFIDKQPPMSLFRELAVQSDHAADNLLLPEEADFYRRHFPDVRLEEIAHRKRR